MIIHKVYGIDFNRYACGGIGNVKLVLIGRETILFTDESEMLTELGKIKSNNCFGEVDVFESQICRNEYKLS